MHNTGKNIIFFAPGIYDEEKSTEILRARDYNVIEAKTLPELLNALAGHDFDIAIFGITPGREDITDLSATIRSICKIPVLFFLPSDTDSTSVDQAKSCADDFIIWPVRDEELILRTELVLSCHSRREKMRQPDSFPIGDMTFDFKNQALYTAGGTKNLTKIEAQLLHLLCLYRNTILPRELALETIWGENDYFKSRSMDVYITKLRKLLRGDSLVSISNIHKVGFRLDIKKRTDGEGKR